MDAFKVKKKKRYNLCFFLFIILIGLFCFAIYRYYLLKEENRILKEEISFKISIINDLKLTLQNEKKKYDTLKKEKEAVSKSIQASEIEDYIYSLKFDESLKKHIQNPKKETAQTIKKSETPKLAIILDDIAFFNEVKKIKSLPFKITPSFFPPSKRHPNTYKYTKDFKVYMIHLPMEAYHFARVESQTLETNDSLQTIEERIKKLKKLFPAAKYLNNHTGSKFTSNLKAMEKFLPVLKKYNLNFLDSRTSPNTKAQTAAKEFNMTLLSRDIFLDNIGDVSYIRHQLKEAVRISKKRGYAIAIGHPRKATFKALKSAKDILKGVEVVYINEI